MKKAAILFTVLLAVITANAQEKRTIGNYTKLNVRGSFDIKLVSGGNELIIKAKNTDVLKDIKTEVENGRLRIYLENNRNHTNAGITIQVPFKDLEEIELIGSGSIETNNTIASENLQVTLSGSGDISLDVEAKNTQANLNGSGDMHLKGKTTNFKTDVVGSGDLEAYGFEAENTDVNVAGSGDAQVYAKEAIRARVEGSGDINFRGNPKKEDTKVSGSGSIEKN